MFLKSLCKSQFTHKSLNLISILVIVKDKLTDVWGSGLLKNDFENPLCEISAVGVLDVGDAHFRGGVREGSSG